MKISAVLSKRTAVSYVVTDGKLQIVGIGTSVHNDFNAPEKSIKDIALEIMAAERKKIKNIVHSALIPELTTTLKQYQRAVAKIEDLMICPYTQVGKRRLLRDYTKISLDDITIVL